MPIKEPWTLVSGASSGIGRSIAMKLSGSNSLILTGRNVDALKETKKQCKPGADIKIWRADFGQPSEIRSSLSDFISHEDIEITGFINSAGFVKPEPVRLISCESSLLSTAINYFSPLEIVSLLVSKNPNNRALQKCIFISSIWSIGGAPGHTNYSGSKAALDGAMRSMAIELAPKVRLNSLSLGAINTPMARQVLNDSDLAEKLISKYPLGIGDVDDVAAFIEFLMSRGARWITGQNIVLDGGRSINYSY